MTRPCLHPNPTPYPTRDDWFRCLRCGRLLHRREVKARAVHNSEGEAVGGGTL